MGFQLTGEPHLLDLAAQLAVRRQDQVLDQLHGDGRTALDRAPGPEIDPQGADHTAQIDPAMLVIALVLDRQEGLRHMLGQGIQRHRAGIERAAHGQDMPLAVHQRDRGLAPGRPQLGGAGRRGWQVMEGPVPADPGNNRAEQHKPAQHADKEMSDAAALLVTLHHVVGAKRRLLHAIAIPVGLSLKPPNRG